VPLWRKFGNFLVVTLGCASLGWAGAALAAGTVSWFDLTVLAACYIPIGFGVTAGYHRLLAHRSFRTGPGLRYWLAILGAAAVQGQVFEWVSDHRKHHAFADCPHDPHSPHAAGCGGLLGATLGFWRAHVGWLVSTQGLANPDSYAPDLAADPGLRLIDRWYCAFVILGFAIPTSVGYLLRGTHGALEALMWGGPVRMALMQQATFSINSLCHIIGRRPYRTSDRSGNVGLLALPTLGESWHHNHHRFPASAHHGLLWWQIDLTAILIVLLSRIGLVWDIVRPPTQQIYRGSSIALRQSHEMSFDVIIPCWNEEPWLNRLLPRLRANPRIGQIIVADNNSSDHSREIAQAYGCTVIRGGSPAQARNAGAAAARGELLLFLDADTVIPEATVGFALRCLQDDSTVAVHFRNLLLTRDVWLRCIYRIMHAYVTVAKCCGIDQGVGTAIATRASTFRQVGGFPEDVTVGEDAVFLRAASRAGRVVYGHFDPIYTSSRRFITEGRATFCAKVLLWTLLRLIGVRASLIGYRWQPHSPLLAAEEERMLALLQDID
jgi:stearoyl-CoA desaturase (delta-9 desaturase)